MVSEANESGSESGKRSDAPQEGGASNHLAARLAPRAPESFAAAAIITRTASYTSSVPMLASQCRPSNGRGASVARSTPSRQRMFTSMRSGWERGT